MGRGITADGFCAWRACPRNVGEQFDVMSRHSYWGGFMPTRKEWDSLSDRARLLVVMAFEQATGTTLTEKTMVPKQIE